VQLEDYEEEDGGELSSVDNGPLNEGPWEKDPVGQVQSRFLLFNVF